MKITYCIFCCLILALPSIAWPDSAPVHFDGIDGTDVVLIKNQQIRMIREVVNIDCAWTTYTVQADFWFKNTTGQTQEVQFGFPVDYAEYGSDWMGAWEEILRKSKESFKVEWRGKPVKFTFGKLQKRNTPRGNRQWICWTSSFSANEEVHHRISYTFPTSRSSGGSKGEEPYANLTYVLKTGAAWQGPIESAIVNIHYDHPIPEFFGGFGDSAWIPDPEDLKFSPKGFIWNRENKTVTWKYQNFVPAEDINFGWEIQDRLQIQSPGQSPGVVLFAVFVLVISIAITTIIVFMFRKKVPVPNITNPR